LLWHFNPEQKINFIVWDKSFNFHILSYPQKPKLGILKGEVSLYC
jgi:hypothetical protein